MRRRIFNLPCVELKGVALFRFCFEFRIIVLLLISLSSSVEYNSILASLHPASSCIITQKGLQHLSNIYISHSAAPSPVNIVSSIFFNSSVNWKAVIFSPKSDRS